MKTRFAVIVALAAICALQPGCGSKEKETRERERVELEEQSRREAEAANKAITDMNQKRFGRKPAEKAAEAPPAEQPTPEEKKPVSETQKQ